MVIETIALGGEGGRRFDEAAVGSISVRSNSRIDALILNGERFGGLGGKEVRGLDLCGDEYINELLVRHGSRIDGIVLRTNRGRALTGGGGGGRLTRLANIRVLGLGGNSGNALDRLRVRYIPDYQESALVDGDQFAVIGVIPAGQTAEFFGSRRISQASAARRILETVLPGQAQVSAGALGEFIAKANGAFGCAVTDLAALIEQLKALERWGDRLTYVPPAGHMGVELVQIDVFEAGDGSVWIFPISEPSIVTVKADERFPVREDLYDLTGMLATRIPALADRRVYRHGYGFYPVK